MGTFPSITLAGGYNEAYPRNDVIIAGLKEMGVLLKRRHVAWSSPFHRTRRLKKLLHKKPVSTDIVFVPSFCHHEVPVVRRHTPKPLFFDPLISRYESKINDYKKASPWSIHALSNYLADKRALKAADVVFADTEEHKKFFCEKYGISEQKIHVLYVGYNAHDFYPALQDNSRKDKPITIGFYGSFIPLHGVDVIIDAADVLRNRADIRFELVGSGHTFSAAQAQVQSLGLNNVRLSGSVDYKDLPRKIRSWDICLGIFGNTRKTDMVIPNKVFHYAACGKPILTKDTPAIKELFADKESIITTDADAHSVAASIEMLLKNTNLRTKLAENASRCVSKRCTHLHIARNFLDTADGYLCRGV